MRAYKNNRYQTIDFFEFGLRVKNLTNSIDQKQAYELRHKVFVNELGWVAPQANGLDIDVYDDERMVPLGIFDQTERLLAHLRITLPQQIFMMEKEFAALIETKINKTNRTVEISRVCTEKDSRTTRIITPYGNYYISMLLYKGLYKWCCRNLINNMYMVLEYNLFRMLRMSGFPCTKIGKKTIMPDGISAVAVNIDWRQFELINKNSRPQLLAWFNDICVMENAA